MFTTKQYILSKTLYVEMAHRLGKGYKGKCNNIHGHSWKITINIVGTKLDEFGMLIDYGFIKERLAKKVDGWFDHKLVLQKDDELIPLLKDKTNLFTMHENPTSEAIAEFLFNILTESIKGQDNYKIHSIDVGETCTSSCTFTHKELHI